MRYNILTVDELGITRIELSNVLRNLSVNIVNVKDEIEAMNMLHEKKIQINVIVWTFNSIDAKDFESIRRMKSREAYKAIPVIIVSKFTDKRFIIKAIECGANEYIAKPYDFDAVQKKFSRLLGINTDKSKNKETEEDIISFSFSDMLNKEIKSASRGGYNLTLLMAAVSLDNSKGQGQDNSEEIIALINTVMKSRLRETDTAFQYGASNLIMLLPFADKTGSKVVENKLQNIFTTHSLVKQKNNGCYELFVTSVTFPFDGKIKDKLLEKLEKNFKDYKRLGIKGF